VTRKKNYFVPFLINFILFYILVNIMFMYMVQIFNTTCWFQCAYIYFFYSIFVSVYLFNFFTWDLSWIQDICVFVSVPALTTLSRNQLPGNMSGM